MTKTQVTFRGPLKLRIRGDVHSIDNSTQRGPHTCYDASGHGIGFVLGGTGDFMVLEGDEHNLVRHEGEDCWWPFTSLDPETGEPPHRLSTEDEQDAVTIGLMIAGDRASERIKALTKERDELGAQLKIASDHADEWCAQCSKAEAERDDALAAVASAMKQKKIAEGVAENWRREAVARDAAAQEAFRKAAGEVSEKELRDIGEWSINNDRRGVVIKVVKERDQLRKERQEILAQAKEMQENANRRVQIMAEALAGARSDLAFALRRVSRVKDHRRQADNLARHYAGRAKKWKRRYKKLKANSQPLDAR